MQRFAMLALAGILSFTLVGCSSEHEETMEDTIALLNEFADELSEIKTNTDLVDAKPDLERLSARLKDQVDKAKKMEKPTAEEELELEKQFKPEMERAQARLKDEMKRIGDALGMEAVATVGGMMAGATPVAPAAAE